MTDTRDEGRTETPVVGLDRLHRYLADAFMRGADKEHAGEVPREYELRIAEAEAWAREYIGLRTENGLIRAPTSDTEDVGEGRLSEIAERNARQSREIEESDPRFVSDEVRAMVDDVAWLLAHLRRTPETEQVIEERPGGERIKCSSCGEPVSTPVPWRTVIRAYIECPECVATQDPNAGD